RIKDPARAPLTDIARAVRAAASDPIEEVRDFRRLLRISALPRPIRRLLWWLALNIGRQRANYFGTFAVSVYSASGAESPEPPAPAKPPAPLVAGPEHRRAEGKLLRHLRRLRLLRAGGRVAAPPLPADRHAQLRGDRAQRCGGRPHHLRPPRPGRSNRGSRPG